MTDLERARIIVELLKIDGFKKDYYRILLKEVFKLLNIKGGVK